MKLKINPKNMIKITDVEVTINLFGIKNVLADIEFTENDTKKLYKMLHKFYLKEKTKKEKIIEAIENNVMRGKLTCNDARELIKFIELNLNENV